MGDSAKRKIARANKHLEELEAFLKSQRPFTYVVETDLQNRRRATLAIRNEAVVEAIAIISGDIVHNLRSSLDHAYWAIVSPLANSDKERRRIQFPFSETRARVQDAVVGMLADRVSSRFVNTLLDLQPHGEPGGNELLYLIHRYDVIDKHRLLIPTGDYRRISGAMLRQQVPDLPLAFISGEFGSLLKDIDWPMRSPPRHLGLPKPPTMHIFQKELDVPVDVMLEVPRSHSPRPLVQALQQMSTLTDEVIDIMRRAS